MITVTDWKGNEIKEGMEICTIRINTDVFLRDSKSGLPLVPIINCWEKWENLTVKSHKGILAVENIVISEDPDGGDPITYHFKSPLGLLKWTANNIIIAIKGISDIEEDYRNYIKQKA